MIEARFEDEEIYNVVSDDVWQWDYGQTLRIYGLNLPSAIEIDFSTSSTGDGTSLSVVGSTIDSVTSVGIPDEMFSYNKIRDYWVYAFIYQTDSTSGETIHRVDIPVKTRPARQDYSGTPTEDIFGGVVQTIEDATNKTAQAVYQVEGYIDRAEEIMEAVESAIGNWKSIKIEKEDGVTTLTITGDDGVTEVATIDDGASAYEVAVEQGFEGTEADWLLSLKGEKGDPGSGMDYEYNESDETLYMWSN